jgi:hypothetical protein
MGSLDRATAEPVSLDAVFVRAFSLDPAERPAGALVFMSSLGRPSTREWFWSRTTAPGGGAARRSHAG